MNQHDDISEKLSAYLDRELDERQAAAVERDVAADAALAKELQELRAVRQLLHDMPRTSAPEGFVEHVMGRAQRLHLARPQATRGDTVIRWVRRSVAAAVLLAFVSICGSVGYSLYKVTRATPHTETPAIVLVDRDKDSDAYPAPEGRFADAKGLDEQKAGSAGRGWDAKDLAQNGETNLTICTTDLPATRKELEHVLKANGVALEQPARMSKGDSKLESYGNNVARVQEARDEEVIYEVQADDPRVVNIRNEVSRLQAQQQVSQIIPMNNTFAEKVGEGDKNKGFAEHSADLKKDARFYAGELADTGKRLSKAVAATATPAAAEGPAKQQGEQAEDAAGHKDSAGKERIAAATSPGSGKAGPRDAPGMGITVGYASRDISLPATRPAAPAPAQAPPVRVAQGARTEDDRSHEFAATQPAGAQQAQGKYLDGQHGNEPSQSANQRAKQEQLGGTLERQLARQAQSQLINTNATNRNNLMIITLQYRPADSPNFSQAFRGQTNSTPVSAPAASAPAAQEAARHAETEAKQAAPAK